jgi:uncharacterized protein YdeI (YjbR/CyaY-like superfamily)
MKKPTFLATPAEFRSWLEKHHDQETELWVGFYRKGSGKPSMTWPESVDEALCFGWIDGIRKKIDEESYTNRFTPRKPTSNWSATNIKRVEELTAAGRMHPAGLAAFAQRTGQRSGVYSYDQRMTARLHADQERRFRANDTAWAFFSAQPPGYRQTAIWWVVSAKKEETRLKRLATLIDDSAHGRRIGLLTRPGKPDESG